MLGSMELARVRRRGAAIIFSSAFVAAVAWACADMGFTAEWTPEASPAFLTPGNDTRANYILLMADRHGSIVADPSRLKGRMVPLELEYRAMLDRLDPVQNREDRSPYRPLTDEWGLSEGSDYGWDRGNFGLCHSNPSGAAAFIAAVEKDPAVPADERTALVTARQALAKACDKAADEGSDLTQVSSPAGRGYAQYLNGARLFYAEKFEAAEPRFAAASSSPSAWVRDVASYMTFRNALGAATAANVGEYGEMVDPAERNRAAIDKAAAARAAYLKAYPTGRYAKSAEELQRRLDWLRGNQAALSSAYSSLLASAATSPGGRPDMALMDEIDLRVVPSHDSVGVTDPALLAILDLMRLRPTQEWDKDRSSMGPLLTRADLAAQARHFARDPELFGYLQAAEAYWGRNAPKDVLTFIPDSAHQSRFSYVQFSRQMLRGLALEAVKDRNARAFWVSLLPGAVQPYQRGAVELAIYRHDQKAGVAGRLLETGSPVLHPLIRTHIIELDATADQLRQTVSGGKTAHERETALYVLLGNELHYGQYRQFLADQLLIPSPPTAKSADEQPASWSADDYDPMWGEWPGHPPLEQFARDNGANKACPTLRTTVTSLADNANAIRPLLCLAEFIRTNSLENWDERWIPEEGKYTINRRSEYGGKAMTRAQIYQMVMDSPAASEDDKAFALNRAVRCYQPSSMNHCGGDDVPQETRKAWFQRLKTRYAKTSWAKELKYYW